MPALDALLDEPTLSDEADAAADEGTDDSASELRVGEVPLAGHGSRLDKALTELVNEFSRSYLQQLIEEGAVLLNDQPVRKASQKVKVGDRLQVELRPTPQSQAFKPEAMVLDVVYEDADLLVVNKPAGLVVHPAPGHWSGTLLNGLLAHHAGASLLPRAGIVHRLDRDTSGLMVVAKTRLTMDRLVQLIAAREVSRQYLALAHRPWVGSRSVTVEAPIGRDPRNRLRMAVVDLDHQSGKTARTDIQLLESTDQGCWVRCKLHTGRTHQIRVHMAHLGHPLLADGLYGGAPAAGMARQALHAWRLAFAHPTSQEPLAFEIALPADLQAALADWGLRYNQGTASSAPQG
ncbi:RluA family pseudouridine synthase [Curvibacter microcysteis]|uniref:RluA family pseudouridine synthase n=1 Tax=Curvibacter microcysteis TaxID=3026419 RepID=UPI0039082552